MVDQNNSEYCMAFNNTNSLCELCKANNCKEYRSCYKAPDKHPVQSPEPALLRVYIQTVIDNKPYYLRTEKVDISDHGIYFIGFDCNQIYLFDFIDVVQITADQKED